MENMAWLIPVIPVIAAVIIVFFTWKLPKASCALAITAIGVSFILSILVLQSTLARGAAPVQHSIPWLSFGSVEIEMGVLLDPLSSMMLIVVTLVSLLVQVYSLGYLKEDPSLSRF